jgi:hypothetical protein
VDGVGDVTVDFARKTATVTMKAGHTLDKAACERAFEGQSYRVADFRTID